MERSSSRRVMDGTFSRRRGRKSGAWLLPYRCYLELPAGTDISMLTVTHNGNSTGIESNFIQNSSEDIYDICGRKLNEMPKSGIVIMNNKNIYIK